MNGNDIKKALECCINGKCKECPLYAMNCSPKVAMAFSVDLINRLEEKNSNLSSDLTSAKAEIERLRKRIKEQKHALFEQQAYTAELQKEIENTQKLLQATINNSLAREELFQFLRTEAIKEFAER